MEFVSLSKSLRKPKRADKHHSVSLEADLSQTHLSQPEQCVKNIIKVINYI